jgi:hypothetical protein
MANALQHLTSMLYFSAEQTFLLHNTYINHAAEIYFKSKVTAYNSKGSDIQFKGVNGTNREKVSMNANVSCIQMFSWSSK